MAAEVARINSSVRVVADLRHGAKSLMSCDATYVAAEIFLKLIQRMRGGLNAFLVVDKQPSCVSGLLQAVHIPLVNTDRNYGFCWCAMMRVLGARRYQYHYVSISWGPWPAWSYRTTPGKSQKPKETDPGLRMMRNQSDLRDGIQFLRNGNGGIGVVHDPESERWASTTQYSHSTARGAACKTQLKLSLGSSKGNTTKLAESWTLGSGIDSSSTPQHRTP